MGERAPYVFNHPHGQFLGLNRLTDKSDFALSVLESAGFLTKNLIDSITNSNTEKISSLSVSGGLSRLSGVNQIKANILQVPVNVCRNYESTSLGCFIFVITSAEGSDFLENIKKYVKFSQTIYPQETQKDYFQSKYNLFVELSLDNFLLNVSSKLNQIKKTNFELKTIKNL